MASMDPKVYYSQHGPFTHPGSYAYLYHSLPCDLEILCGVVNGLIVHDLWTQIGQMQIPEERRKEAEIRSMEAKLQRILEMDPSPLSEARPFEERLFGNCRDEALMLCSFLRHQGIPARVRKGFMANAGPKKLDHAVCQVWNESEQRWLTVDVQMDNMVRESHRLSPEAQQYLAALTPRDVPAGDFLMGGEAWLRCRQGEDDPLSYGIEGDLWGLWMVRHNLLRDLLALNKYELIPWDLVPGSMINHDQGELTADQLAYLDHVAELTIAGDAAFTEVRRLYDENETIHVPVEWFKT